MKMKSACEFSVILLFLLCSLDSIFAYQQQSSRIIIVEDAKVCFKRALAGKRVTRGLVRRALPCGRIEDCQQECQDEKRFNCEGFNYRLDPTGRGNGDCELLDLPMIRIDIGREVFNDPDYDIYEKDRNAYPDCKHNMGMGGGFRDRYDDFRPSSPAAHHQDNRYDDRRPPRPYYDRHDDRHDDHRRPPPPPPGSLYMRPDRGPAAPMPSYYHDKRIDGGGYGRPHYGHVVGGNGHDSYLPTGPTYLPTDYYPRETDHWQNNWDRYPSSEYLPDRFNPNNNHNNKGIPSPYDIPSGDTYAPKPNTNLIPISPTYLPYGTQGGTTPNYGIVIPINGNHFGQPKPTYGGDKDDKEHPGYDYRPNFNVPITEENYPVTNGDTVEHKGDDTRPFNTLKDECSLRTATGFRLHKIIVKNYFSVPDIYECETLCYKEQKFNCNSYAYRYTLTTNEPTDNCYLSNKNYKELDFYTDLEPDRDFDIYTMNNKKKCQEQIPKQKEYSDCFWHTRSGQRLEQKVVRLATLVKTVVECQLECLRVTKFLCRGFSFRYGSPTIGGIRENCLLTDWPFQELNPLTQFSTETGFEVYERGSFGHGCEPNHFAIRGKDHPIIGSKTDQLCYIGYGSPARLLPQAIRKSLRVNSELDCKLECTKLRHSTLFQCMSFSFRSKSARGDPNCDLSDILQRDLLSDLDYIGDPDSWLFAWDNYNPECVALIDSKPLHDHRFNEPPPLPRPPPPGKYGGGILPYDSSHGIPFGNDYGPIGRDEPVDIHFYGGYSPTTALDTWRVYTVSGWPCRRGTKCRQNRDAGFWSCELEGGDRDTWDYCCHPDHQCGYSEGYQYQWCYVGPQRTQWRKCSERYYPYTFSRHDDYHHHHNEEKPYLPTYNPHNYDRPPFVTGGYIPDEEQEVPRRPHRPFRPRPRPRLPPKSPTLNQYEREFDMQFLEPPKPVSGFGQPRLWPVSYLHRELPPDEGNRTEYKFERNKEKKEKSGRLTAIHNLIQIIKSNDLEDIKYEIDNKTNLLVQIPLPGNFSSVKNKTNSSDESLTRTTMISTTSTVSPTQQSLPTSSIPSSKDKTRSLKMTEIVDDTENVAMTNVSVREIKVPTYRKSYIVRTNKTNRAILETQ